MDLYSLLKFSHIVGFTLLGGGLLPVFVSEFQAYRTRDLQVFTEAARYTAIFYDSLVIAGALMVALSGVFLVLTLGHGFFETPWLIGMWALFLFEFVEGNTITRLQFRKTLRRSRQALARGDPLTDDLRDEAGRLLNRIVHFLDIPLFAGDRLLRHGSARQLGPCSRRHRRRPARRAAADDLGPTIGPPLEPKTVP